MSKRKPLSNKVRFEVFKRDSFTCQYCGKMSPDVVLQVDHLKPVSNGGDNDIMNLVTACVECNSGKSNTPLSDNVLLSKQQQQLTELNERKQQMEMMFEWKRGLLSLEEDAVLKTCEYWNKKISGYALNHMGEEQLRKLVKKYSVSEVLNAMDISEQIYIEHDEDGQCTQESVQTAFNKLNGVCSINRKKKKLPGFEKLFYARGILRKRFFYVDESLCMKLLEECLSLGASISDLLRISKRARNWTAWRIEMEELQSILMAGGESE